MGCVSINYEQVPVLLGNPRTFIQVPEEVRDPALEEEFRHLGVVLDTHDCPRFATSDVVGCKVLAFYNVKVGNFSTCCVDP